MQHVLNIAFDFDDDKVKNIAENAIKNNIDEIISSTILDIIAPYEYSYTVQKSVRSFESVKRKVDEQICKFLDEHKDEIIDQAAERLNESLKRTKAWKERYSEVINND